MRKGAEEAANRLAEIDKHEAQTHTDVQTDENTQPTPVEAATSRSIELT